MSLGQIRGPFLAEHESTGVPLNVVAQRSAEILSLNDHLISHINFVCLNHRFLSPLGSKTLCPINPEPLSLITVSQKLGIEEKIASRLVGPLNLSIDLLARNGWSFAIWIIALFPQLKVDLLRTLLWLALTLRYSSCQHFDLPSSKGDVIS